jgi:hypothetical protein
MQPEFYPIWAQVDQTLPVAGTPNKIRPEAGIRDVGFDLGEQPAAEEFNWMWNNIYQWLQYLNEETIISREIGNAFENILEAVDVRDLVLSFAYQGEDSSSTTELATATRLSADYSLNQYVEIKSEQEYQPKGKELVFQATGVAVSAATAYEVFFEVDGTKVGVIVTSSGARRLTNNGEIDGTYTFVNGSTISLVLRNTGQVEVWLNSNPQVTQDSITLNPNSVVKVGVAIDGTTASTFTVDVGTSFEHSYLINTTGLNDASGNPFSSEVPGVDNLDSRKLSLADRVRPGVVKLATEQEAIDLEDGVASTPQSTSAQINTNSNINLSSSVIRTNPAVVSASGRILEGLEPDWHYMVVVTGFSENRGGGNGIIFQASAITTSDATGFTSGVPPTVSTGTILDYEAPFAINWPDGNAQSSFTFFIQAPANGEIRAWIDGTAGDITSIKAIPLLARGAL